MWFHQTILRIILLLTFLLISNRNLIKNTQSLVAFVESIHRFGDSYFDWQSFTSIEEIFKLKKSMNLFIFKKDKKDNDGLNSVLNV